MSDRLKRILIVIIFLAIAALIGFGIWWFFFRPVFRPPAPPAPPTPAAPPVALPPAAPAPPRIPVRAPPEEAAAPTPVAAGGITQTVALSNLPVLAPFLSADGTSLLYYNRSDGKFYRIRPDGTLEALSDKVFFNVSSVTWAGDKNRAILEYPDGSNILYDFVTRKPVTLPRHWRDFSFSPQSDRIAFLSIGDDPDSSWLATASPDGSGTKPVEPLGNNASKVQVSWSPNNQVIAFSKTGLPQSFNNEEILLVGQHGENFRSLIVNGIGFRGQWSPDGRQLLYSATSAADDWKPRLWVVGGTPDSVGANKTPLGINTWADKCFFGKNSAVYCAAPQELPRGAGLYPAVSDTIADELWRIDLQNGERQRIAIPSEEHTIERVVVSDDERYLYFTDKISGQLFKINLK